MSELMNRFARGFTPQYETSANLPLAGIYMEARHINYST